MKLLNLLFFITTLNLHAQDSLKVLRAAKDYANAIVSNNYGLIVKATVPSYLQAIGGKKVLIKRLRKEEAEMNDAKETYAGASIIFTGKMILASVSYNFIDITTQIRTLGGICRLTVPYIAIESKGKTSQFFEAADLNMPSVKARYKELVSRIKVPRRGMRIFLEDQTFTKDMPKYDHQEFTKDMIMYNRSFIAQIRKYGLEYHEPPGYVVSDSTIMTVDSVVGHQQASIKRSFRSNDGILIGISFNGPIDTAGNSGFPGPDGLPFDANKNWIPIFHWKYQVLPKEYTEKTYNADVAAVYEFYQHKNIPVLSKNERCKSVIIHKDNVVDIEIMYFYTPASEYLLKKHMDATKNILRFK